MKKLILILLCLTGFSFAADYQIPSQLVGSSPTSVSLGTNIFENEAIAVFETDILAKNKGYNFKLIINILKKIN